MNRSAFLLTLLAPVVVAGCNQVYPPTSEATFGDAVRHNMTMQVVNPEPLPQTAATAPFDGDRAALMMLRYKSDQVEEPAELRTTTVGGGGEGGGEEGGGGE